MTLERKDFSIMGLPNLLTTGIWRQIIFAVQGSPGTAGCLAAPWPLSTDAGTGSAVPLPDCNNNVPKGAKCPLEDNLPRWRTGLETPA